jgi:hypothetical protein
MSSLMSITLVFGCLLLIGCDKSRDDSSSTTVFLTNPKVDLGILAARTPISQEWELVNQSPRDVEVQNLVLSCACMETDFIKGKLRAGDSKIFHTVVSDPTEGETLLTGRLLIKGQREPIEFEWSYQVEPPARLEPDVFNLGNLWLSEEKTTLAPRIVEVTNLGPSHQPEKITQLKIQGSDEHALEYEVASDDNDLVEGSVLKVTMRPKSDSIS